MGFPRKPLHAKSPRNALTFGRSTYGSMTISGLPHEDQAVFTRQTQLAIYTEKRESIVLDDIDVLREIFIRLPVKCLLKCKSVCKCWYRIISDPIFISDYSCRNPQYHVSGFYLQKFLYLQQNPELLFFTCEGKIDAAPQPSLSFIDDENGVQIMHSCNGLLLCSSFRCYEDDKKYYICKPTTKQYLHLPKPKYKQVFGMSIAYDPSYSPEYQVICVCDSNLSSNHRQIKIYSSKRSSWKVSGYPFLVQGDILFNCGVYWNGALHWVGKDKWSLRFDVEEELLLQMPMPAIEDGWEERRIGYFGESKGHLYLIEIYGPQATIFNVMEMRSDYSGWSVKYRVNLEALALRYRQMVRRDWQGVHRHIFAVLHLVHNQIGEIKGQAFLVLHIPGDLITYNLADGTWMGLVDACPQFKTIEQSLGLWYSREGVHPYTNILPYF